ncbi:hypothetical protein [Dongshaea marina]|uniref:hypothetical protein n=1 Tax=Dongshaea marina TaxID=2047966 RepID=UPI000D3ED145|nr:hypothetical protein [Dongshaea marina]
MFKKHPQAYEMIRQALTFLAETDVPLIEKAEHVAPYIAPLSSMSDLPDFVGEELKVLQTQIMKLHMGAQDELLADDVLQSLLSLFEAICEAEFSDRE